MKKLIILGFIVYAVLIAFPSKTISLEPPVKPKPAPKTTAMLIDEYATTYKVSAAVMHKVIKCESNYNSKAVGDGGKSFGLVQIHLPSHPTITKAQAYNKEFAIKFLAQKLSTKQGRMWTCYRTQVV